MGEFSVYRRLVSIYGLIALLIVPYMVRAQWHSLGGYQLRFLALLAVVAIFKEVFPVVRGSIAVSLSLTVYLIVFAWYGYAAEMIMSQFIMLAAGLMVKRKRNWERLAANSVMFLLMSTFSALVFQWLGGHTGEPVMTQWLPYTGYFLTYFIINHLILFTYLLSRSTFQPQLHFRGIGFDLSASIFAAFLAFLTVEVFSLWTESSRYILAIPLLTIAYIFKLYNDLSQSNYQFSVLAKMGAKFTAELELNRMFEVLTVELRKLMDYSVCCVYFINEELRVLEPVCVKANTTEYEEGMAVIQVPLGGGPIGHAALSDQPILVDRVRKRTAWNEFHHPYLVGLESIIAVPLIWENRILGVLMVGHFNAGAFHGTDLDVVTVLANQTSVAIENAKRFERSERRSIIDELTGLINYRQFDHLLHKEFHRAEKEGHPITLLVIDIDYFKQVNDTFGHQAGNEVLSQLAQTIQRYVGEETIVARYGGEEFTILLPESTVEGGFYLAEGIRSLAEQTVMTVSTLTGEQQNLSVTLSIGLACFPDQAHSPMELLRHADRAMYYGSKKGGRNRVAAYQPV
ncbi:MAG: hypothetical protein JWN30_733 [Bacilli bacterium]|nr:hypothetical protein [Bacilli bacterium]